MKKLKLSRPVIYAALAAVVAVAYVMVTEEPARRSGLKKPPGVTAKSALPVGFTQEDFSAKFDPVNDPAKSAFQPLIASNESADRVGGIPGQLPSALTGGDPNWMYTGMAEIDGRAVGLIENQSTGEGVFVRIAELWKQAEILQIEPMSITVRGTNGRVYVLSVRDTSGSYASSRDSGQTNPNLNQPVTPNLRGPIGNLEVVPMQEGQTNPNSRRRNNVAGNERSETLDAND